MPGTDVFAHLQTKAWPHIFDVELEGKTAIAAGTPSSPDVIESWLKKALAHDTPSEEQLTSKVFETLAEIAGDYDTPAEAEQAAVEKTAKDMKLNVFKRDENGLYLDGRCVKACIKEATSIAVAGGYVKQRGWGTTNKGLISFVEEHIMVEDDRVHLGATAADGEVETRFVPKFIPGKGPVTAITSHERLTDWTAKFTVKADWNFHPDDWGHIWLKACENGLGSARSQGFGKFTVVRFEPRVLQAA